MPRIARAQSIVAQRSRGRFDVRAVACGWLAVGALRPAFVTDALRVSCPTKARSNETSSPSPSEPPSAPPSESCAGKPNGSYCSETRPDYGYICLGGGLTLIRCTEGSTCHPAETGGTDPVVDCRK
jgi:hypothetical protein